MSNMWIQALIWMGAVALLFVYLKRRRNRKMMP
jgi:hypothetical protein